MVKYIAQLRQQGVLGANRLNERTRGWLWILANAAKEALKPDTAITAAAIAYFALFSLFPITLLSIAIASFSLGPSMDRQLIIQRLEFIAPALGQMLGQNIDEIIEARGSVTGSMIAHLRTLLPDPIISMGGGVSLVLAILLDVALFMVLYMMLPHGGSTWRVILPGAMGAGFLWELAKKVFLSFVSTYISVSNPVYGSVAAIIAFLAWAYLSGLIFLFGAYLSVSYFQLKQHQKETVGEIHQ